MRYPVFANGPVSKINQALNVCRKHRFSISALLCFALLSFSLSENARPCKAVQGIDGKLCLHCTRISCSPTKPSFIFEQIACFSNERINLSNTDLFNKSLCFIHSYNAFALVKLIHTFVRQRQGNGVEDS